MRDQFARQAGAAGELAGRAGAFALLLHQPLVVGHGRFGQARVLLAQDVGDQVRRAAVGVVQLEQLLAVDAATALLQIAFEALHAGVEGLRERGFLGLQRALDQLALLQQFRIRLAHDLAPAAPPCARSCRRR